MSENKILDRLRDVIKSRESEKRYRHTLGVEQEATELGSLLLPDKISELRAAALLHDVTKCLCDEEQFSLARQLGLVLTPELLASPQVLHGFTAARLIPKEFPDFATPEIIHAVAIHTTGDTEMSLFDKIIFVADYTEPGRQQIACQETRAKMWALLKAADNKYHVFDLTVCQILRDTIQYLRSNQRPVVSATEEAYRALSQKLNGKK